ncbi:plasmid segregation protein ParM [Anaerosolibacter carboniphilus]|uniref:Plasmid segregation protein ParM n=1 Tax=Anaerosolibacter carboniphilus TaxID=1417629 RepID=A0A841KMQ9_9FIRM|nr:ParM/StbA family protein [Anaerosolibacter carboniphilus]MBB6215084.1 plasmid segregation protein ParM [Anaerosolibacter carboniphilus]
MKELKIIGIDHGNASIKTHTGFECKSGFTILNDEPISQKRLLQFESKYYSIGSERFPVKADKTLDEDFFVLSLGAIAESIVDVANGLVGERDIILSAGLPIVNYGRMKERFKSYFIRNNIGFIYESREYLINIKDCFVFPQSYSALLTKFSEYKNLPLVNVCDIGGGTCDCFVIEYGLLNTSSCFSLPVGAIHLYNNIIQQALALGYHLTESQIQQMILGKQPTFKDEGLFKIVNDTATRFTQKLLSQVGEHGFELRLNPTVFCGGGSILLKQILEENNTGYTEVIEDSFTNAKGFEMLAKQKLLKR